MVRELLSSGADVNWRQDYGWSGVDDARGNSGLHIAATHNYGELLELHLAQTEVDVNIKAKYSSTPLMVACSWGHENIVRRLCQVSGTLLYTWL